MSPWVRTLSLAAGVMLGLGVSTACKVINPEHCANKDKPGNEWCSDRSRSTPFCSPCVSAFNGCVAFEPFACEGYDPSIFGGEQTPMDDDESSGGGSSGSGSSTG